jgi:ABC-type polysaccharide/polyol phosphate transport system ATPase subunit
MYGRLAFSVAVNMEPDILLIDEALSVGDARFKRKSLDKMRELCDQARTIFIVSHALKTMHELADEVIWIHQGRLKLRDEPDAAIGAYEDFLGVSRDDEAALEDP